MQDFNNGFQTSKTKIDSDASKSNLRVWVLLLALIPTLVMGIVLATIFTVNKTYDEDSQVKDRIKRITDPVALSLAISISNNQRDEAKRLLTNLQLNERGFVRSISVFDDQNQLFVTSHFQGEVDGMRYENSLITLTKQELQYVGNDILVRAPIFKLSDDERSKLDQPHTKFKPGPMLGYISIIFDNEKATEGHHTSIILAFIVVLCGVQINLLFTIRLVRYFTGPISEITSLITHVRYGTHVSLIDKSYISELDTMKEGINYLAHSVQHYRTETDESVQQATGDLLRTLEQIEIQNVELDMAKKRAQEASRTKSEFLANMSHELRTPLNGVIGFSKQLAKTPLHSSQLEYIQTIERSANNLLSIINDILDFSKLEAGKMVIENIPFGLRDCLDETLAIISTSAHEKGLEIVVDVEADVPDNVNGDSMHLNQIITNLVGNAIKFTDAGSISVKVSLESSHLNKVILRFEVEDTGIGIREEHQKNLFQAFTQAESSISRRFGGTGLGLIITQRLVSSLNGEISFSSKEGFGSKFWFTMPLELCQFKLGDSIPIKSLSNKSILIYEPRTLSSNMLAKKMRLWNIHYRMATSLDDLKAKLASSLSFNYLILSCNGLCHEKEVSAILDIAQPKVGRVFLLHDCHQNEQDIEKLRGSVDGIISTPFTDLALARQLLYSQNTEQPAEPIDIKQPIVNDRKSLTVLAVDDNPANLMLIKTLLEELVTNVVTAASGADAVKISQSQRFDLILMDIQMPDIDGIAATQLIREKSVNRNTPVIAVTAHAIDEEKQKILSSGIEGHLPKPIDDKALSNVIDKWVVRPKFTHFDVHTLNWELCLTQASQKQELAIEMLKMLLDTMPETTQLIDEALESRNNEAMLAIIHKLHGACCYCGVPTTQKLCQQIESSLKQGHTTEMLEPEILELLDELTKVESAIKQVISQLSSEIS